MRAVCSAMRRSFASAATAFASPNCGARKTSRCVSRTANNLSRSVVGGSVSRHVMTGLLSKHRGGAGIPSPPRSWNPFRSSKYPPGHWVPADLGIHRLFGRSLRHRKNGYVGAAFGFGIERHATSDLGEQGVVLADTDILAGMPLGTALARDNVAGETGLAAKHLHAEALTARVAPVAR